MYVSVVFYIQRRHLYRLLIVAAPFGTNFTLTESTPATLDIIYFLYILAPNIVLSLLVVLSLLYVA